MQVILVCWNCLAKGDGIKQCQSVTCRADGCKKHNHSLLNETKKLIASQPIMEKVHKIIIFNPQVISLKDICRFFQ